MGRGEHRHPVHPASSCSQRLTRTPPPAAIVIFGATGDLTKRKLVPALYNLAAPAVCCHLRRRSSASRGRELTDDEFRANDAGGRRGPQPGPGDRRGRLGGIRAPPALLSRRRFDDRGRVRAPRRPAATVGPRRRAPAATGSSTSPPLPSSSPSSPSNLGARRPGRGGRRPGASPASSSRSPSARISRSRARAQRPSSDSRLPRAAGLPDRPLPREGDGPEPPRVPVRQRDLRADLEPPLRRPRADHRGRGPRRGARAAATTTRAAPCATSSRTTCCRCSSIVAMEPPARFESREVRDEKVKVLRAIPPFDDRACRNTWRGARPVRGRAGSAASASPAYREETGVDPRRRPRRSSRCGSRSTTGAGRGPRSTCAPASACRGARPRWRSSSSRRRTCRSHPPRCQSSIAEPAGPADPAGRGRRHCGSSAKVPGPADRPARR